MSNPAFTPEEIEEFRKAKIAKEIKQEVTNWAKNKFWFLATIGFVLVTIGPIAIVNTIIGSRLDSRVEEAMEQGTKARALINDADEALSTAKEAIEKATKAAKLASESSQQSFDTTKNAESLITVTEEKAQKVNKKLSNIDNQLKKLSDAQKFAGEIIEAVKYSSIKEFAYTPAPTLVFESLVEMYIKYPIRAKRYQPKSQHHRLEAMSEKRATGKPELLLRHRVIEEYLVTLGHIAANETSVDQSEELSRLITNLQSQAGTQSRDTEAFQQMAQLLTEVVSDNWQRPQLRELIKRSNPPLQTLLKTLKQIIVDGFGGDARNEQINIQNYYRLMIAQSSDPAGIAAISEWQEYRMNELEQDNEGLTRTYLRWIAKIAEGHQSLYDQRDVLAKSQ